MEIIEALKEGICQINVTVDKKIIPADKGLIESGILDSYGFIEFVTYIEKNYNIELQDDEINNKNFADLNTIAAFIQTKLQE
jgi:acyl carrier protein